LNCQSLPIEFFETENLLIRLILSASSSIKESSMEDVSIADKEYADCKAEQFELNEILADFKARTENSLI